MTDQHPSRYQVFLQGILLFGYALFLFKLIVSGTLHNFIAPRLEPLILLALFGFFLFGVIQCIRSLAEPDHDHSSHDHHDHHHHKPTKFLHLLFLFPVMTGFLFHNTILTSSVAENRGVSFESSSTGLASTNASSSKDAQNLVELTTKTNTTSSESDASILKDIAAMQPSPNSKGIIDMAQFDDQLAAKMMSMQTVQISSTRYSDSIAAIEDHPDMFKGKPITLTGFAVRPSDFTSNQLVLSRFVITCCIADASVFGLMASGKDLAPYKKDEWLTITGTLDETTYKNKKVPIIHVKDVKAIPVPKNPYVYDTF